MVHMKNIWCFLCFVCFNELESTKVYLVKFSDSGEVQLSNNIKNSINKFEQNDQNKRPEIYKTEHKILIEDIMESEGDESANIHTLVCDLFINNKHQIRCTKNVKISKRSASSALDGFDFFETLKSLAHPLYNIYSPNVRQNEDNKKFVDLTRLSQDSIDVEDLGRSQRFSFDYIDIKDFRSGMGIPDCNSIEPDEFSDITSIKCLPLTRKTGLSIESLDYPSFKLRASESTSDSSESVERKPKKHAKVIHKPKRFHVVKPDGDSVQDSDKDSDSNNNENDSNENKISSLEIDNNVKINDEEDSSEDNAVPTQGDHSGPVEKEIINIHNVPVNLDSEDTESEESDEPPKTIKNKPKLSFDTSLDRYAYLQGNKYYNQNIKSYDDFRRGNRLPYFLPKRFYWKDEEIQRLGYFWFNGPKGKFMAAK